MIHKNFGFTGIEILVVLVVVGVLGGGTAVAADNARPGDVLFGLDLAIENVRERLTADPVKKFELKIKQAQERAAELEELGEELMTDTSGRAEERVQSALDLTSQALQQAEARVSELAQTIPASDKSNAAASLQRVSELLRSLQENRDQIISTLTRLKSEVRDDEVKQRIETVTDGIRQVVRIEQKTEDDGRVEQRVKVYQIDPITGEETKILDIEDKDGETRVKNGDENDTDVDDVDPDEADEEEDELDNGVDNEDEPTRAPEPTKMRDPTETPKPTRTPTPTEAEQEDDSGSGSDESRDSETYEIKWKDGRFENANRSIRVDDRIKWKNEEDEIIQVSSNPHPVHTTLPGLESGSMGKGQEYIYTFTTAGTFGYHSHLSPGQGGTITVAD